MASIAAIATSSYLILQVLPNLAKDSMTTRWWISMWLDVTFFSLGWRSQEGLWNGHIYIYRLSLRNLILNQAARAYHILFDDNFVSPGWPSWPQDFLLKPVGRLTGFLMFIWETDHRTLYETTWGNTIWIYLEILSGSIWFVHSTIK